MAPGALGPAAVAVSLASRLPRGGGGGSSLSAAAWWGFSEGRLSVLGAERLVCFLSAITCLADMTRRRGGVVPFVESGFLHSSPTAAASEMAEA